MMKKVWNPPPPGVFAVRGDVSCSTTLCTEGGVGDASWFSVLPWTQDPADTIMHTQNSTAFPFPNRPNDANLLSSSLRVPLSRANSLSCIFRRSFWSSGVSMPCFRILRIWTHRFATVIVSSAIAISKLIKTHLESFIIAWLKNQLKH